MIIATIVTCGPEGRRRVEVRPIPAKFEEGDFEWGDVDGTGKVLAPFIRRWKPALSEQELALLTNGEIITIDDQERRHD